jgi:hypothetical protein
MLKVIAVLGLLVPGMQTPAIKKIDVESVAECTAKISEFLDQLSKSTDTYQGMGQCMISHDKDKEASTD